MRLIDADALKNHYSWWEGGTKENTLDEQKEIFDTIVNLQPTIDPVKRGKWITGQRMVNINDGEIRAVRRCSECGSLYFVYDDSDNTIDQIPNYCPNCGARMERNEE